MICRSLKWILGVFKSPPVPQNCYADVGPRMESSKVIYRQVVTRSTKAPYTVKFHDPHHVITGIACFRKDDKTATPEAEVVDGGVSHTHVKIDLRPVQKGEWTCCIQIYGVPGDK
jgi:hypothetical protein